MSYEMKRFWGRTVEGTSLGTPGYKVRPNNTINKREAFDFLGIFEEIPIHPCCVAALYEYYGNEWKDHLDEVFSVSLTFSEPLDPNEYLVAWDLSFSLYHNGYYNNGAFHIDDRYTGYHLIECELNGTTLWQDFILFKPDSTSFTIPVDQFRESWQFLRSLGMDLIFNEEDLTNILTDGSDLGRQIVDALEDLNFL